MIQEIGNQRQETRERRQEAGDKRQHTGDRRSKKVMDEIFFEKYGSKMALIFFSPKCGAVVLMR